MKVAIRDDDVSYFTNPQELMKAYDFLSEDDCVSLSIVPFTVPVHRGDVFPYGEGIRNDYYDIADNRELLSFIRDGSRKGRYDCLLHGYSHEYRLQGKQWIAEMKWKSKDQLKKDLTEGKQHLEMLLGIPIFVFVAPNNSIDQKAISVIEELKMDYSGIIMYHDRNINLRYIINFIKRWSFRVLKKIQYPGILNYGKHKELAAYTVDDYERLVYEYHVCKKKKVPFVIYTHYWQLNRDEKVKRLLKKIYKYAKNDGAQVVPLSQCFEGGKS